MKYEAILARQIHYNHINQQVTYKNIFPPPDSFLKKLEPWEVTYVNFDKSLLDQNGKPLTPKELFFNQANNKGLFFTSKKTTRYLTLLPIHDHNGQEARVITCPPHLGWPLSCIFNPGKSQTICKPLGNFTHQNFWLDSSKTNPTKYPSLSLRFPGQPNLVGMHNSGWSRSPFNSTITCDYQVQEDPRKQHVLRV